jgi:hypothetical protein
MFEIYVGDLSLREIQVLLCFQFEKFEIYVGDLSLRARFKLCWRFVFPISNILPYIIVDVICICSSRQFTINTICTLKKY